MRALAEKFGGPLRRAKRIAVSLMADRAKRPWLIFALAAIGSAVLPVLTAFPVTAAQIVSNNWSNSDSGSDFVLHVTASTKEIRDPVSSYPESSTPGVVIVGPKLAAYLKNLGPNVVFYTSRANPLKRLSEITDANIQFAAWGVPTDFQVVDVLAIKYQLGGELRNPHFIGNLNFSKLFVGRPKLRLFVTSQKIRGVDSIESSGGGLKIKLAEPPPSQ